MIQFHAYPGGKKRIVTFSYDDGHENDKRLSEIFNKYGVKATFHINGQWWDKSATDEQKAELKKRYDGHEVSCHTYSHGWPSRMPSASLVGEVMKDRKILEDMVNYPVIGMSYPSGSYSDEAISVMKACGIVYSRTVDNTMDFCLPDDFMKWHPSCHHKDAMTLCDRFLDNIDSPWVRPLFYIWGHSHEIRTEEDWEYIEKLIKKLSGNDKIWYATNIEIYNYMTAQKQLQISADETVFYNPTATDVWVEKDKKEIIHIPAGKQVTIA